MHKVHLNGFVPTNHCSDASVSEAISCLCCSSIESEWTMMLQQLKKKTKKKNKGYKTTGCFITFEQNCNQVAASQGYKTN